MPKFPTYPTLYDEVLQINLTKLNLWGYLKPHQIKSGTLTWSRNGEETGSISIKVNTIIEQPYIELDYKYNDKPRNYRIDLVTIPSNLGRGEIWYFLCPQTNKRCRKLYSIGGYFLHRNAFKGCMYNSQVKSKYYRRLNDTLGAYFKTDQLYEQLNKKYIKKYYAGKLTKRYLQLVTKINKIERFTPSEIEHLIIR